MKLFKKTAMSLALGVAVTSGALMMGVSAPVQAVNIAQDGLGQVLVFPYYNTRDGWSSLYTLTNTSNKTIIVKVRWREGVNSRDVRDFNVILSPYDVWTAGTRSTGDGAGMFTPDNSCTFPKLPSLPDIGGTKVTGIDFSKVAYTKKAGTTEDNRDKGSESLDRTKEGYFEVFEMAVITPTRNGSGDIVRGSGNAAGVAYYSKHNRVGNNKAVPRDCTAVRQFLREDKLPATRKGFEAPENVLKGEALLVKGSAGIAAGYNPLALANFTTAEDYDDPDSPRPNLNDASPAFASIIDDNDPTKVTAFVPASGRGVDAVSELIKRSAVINNYNVDGDSATSWVMTFPTKNFYVDRPLYAGNAHSPLSSGKVSLAPFDNKSVSGEVFGRAYNAPNGKSCFDVNFNIWDREEFDTPPQDIEDGFSPREPGASTNQPELCYETNVVSFGGPDGDPNIDGEGLFSSKLVKKLPDSILPGQNGWGKMTFGSSATAALPVIGMKMEIRNRGDATVNYGFANDHAYQR